MKELKVIKEFGCAQKGDVLKANEDGLFELNAECNCNDCYSSRTICVSADVADTLLSAGYLQEIETETCDCCEALEKVKAEVEALLEQYEKDHQALLDDYNEGEIPPCVKLEADTVYYNLNKVLNHIKDLLNE